MADVAETATYPSGVTAVVAGTPRTASSVNLGLANLASRTKWLKDRFYDLLVGAPKTISAVDTGTDRMTVTSHAIPSNTAVQVFAANGGTLPGGLSAGTVYYVGVIDANTITLSASSGPGATVDLTAGYVGDCYVSIIPDWLSTLLIADATYGYGKLTSLVVFLAGAQTITGAKLFDSLTLSGVTNLLVTSRTITRSIPVAWINATSGVGALSTNAVTLIGGTAEDWNAQIELPHGQLLNEITIRLNPVDVGALPGTMPSMTVFRTHIDTGTETNMGSIVDASGTTGAYNAAHSITVTGIAHTIDRNTYDYGVVIRGSSGATPANDIVAFGLRASITATSVKYWT